MKHLRIAYLILSTLLTFAAVYSQEAPTLLKCDHTSNSRARFDHIRMLPPVKIEQIGEGFIRVGDRLGSETYNVDKESIIKIPQDYENKLFWVMYCDRDRHLYVIIELSPDQLKKN